MSDLAVFATEALKNPMFAGIMAAGLTGGAMMAIRSVLPYAGRIFREQFCTSLVVYNNEKFYQKLKVFLSKHKYAASARSNSVAEWYSWQDEDWKWGMTPGAGWHFFWHKGNFYVVYRNISATALANNTGWNGPQRDEQFYFYTLGRNQNALVELLTEVHDVLDEPGTVPIYIWTGGAFELAQYREKRSLDTIFIPDAQKARIVDDIQQFLDSRDVYRRRGTPYRRGYMLEGPPGTGKSSIILSLAGHFDKPVYIINPSTLTDDNTLQRAFNAVEGNGILLIEDIDAVSVTEQRTEKAPAQPEPKKDLFGLPNAAPEEPKKSGITLSGLLNGIDGVIARDGRLLFITTNHAGNLDEALIRPGRIDLREHLGLMDMTESLSMFECFHPSYDIEAFRTWIAPQLPMSPAAMQNVLLSYRSDTPLTSPSNDVPCPMLEVAA